MEEEEDIKLEKLTEAEKTAVTKELAIFALVAFLLYAVHLILPSLIRVCLNIIHSFTK